MITLSVFFTNISDLPLLRSILKPVRSVDYVIDKFFMPPDRMIWGILFLPVCLFVCLSLSVCLSVVNFNHRYNFLTLRERDFIFGMHTIQMTPFQMTPRSMTL